MMQLRSLYIYSMYIFSLVRVKRKCPCHALMSRHTHVLFPYSLDVLVDIERNLHNCTLKQRLCIHMGHGDYLHRILLNVHMGFLSLY